MKLLRKKAATSQILEVFIQDTRLGDGGGLTGLVFNTASLTCYSHRNRDLSPVLITLVTMTVGTFTSSGFKEIDATNMPGWYQLCLPDAGYATGAESVTIHLKGAANMGHVPLEIQLTDLDVNQTLAAGIWDEATTGHVTAGTFGEQLKSDVDLLLVNLNTVDDFLDTEIAALQTSINTLDDFVDTEVAAIKAVTDLLPNGGALTSLATQASVNTIDDFLDTEIAALQTSINTLDDFVDTEVAAIKAVIDLLPNGGALTSLATQASVDTIDDFLDTEVAAIKTVTDAITATGTGLTAIPWNIAWDAEVQSEVADALGVYDAPTHAELVTQINTVRNDITLIPAAVWASATRTLTSFGTLAADVWASVTRTLTAGTNIVLTKGTGVTGFNDVSTAQVQTSAAAALTSYDPPTHSELITEINSVQTDVAAVPAAVWASGARTLTSFGTLVADTAAAVWASVTRVLTAGTNIVLAKGTGVTGFNDLSAAQVNTEVDTAIADAQLDEFVDMIELDGGLYRFTVAALAQAPTGGGGGGANISLAKGTGVTGFNDLSAAQVNAEVDTGLADYDAPTSAELVAEINTVQVDIAAVAARLPATLTAGGNMKSDMLALNGSLNAAVLLALSAGTMVTAGAIAGTLSTTQMTTNLTEVTDDHYKGRLIAWLSPSTLFGQYSIITSYDGTTKRITYVAITEAPVAGDTFIII